MTLIIQVSHTGLYADGRPNTSSVFLKDLDFGFENQNRKEVAYIPPGGTVNLPYTDKSAYSFVQGDIAKFTIAGLLTSQLIASGSLDFSSTVATVAGSYPLGASLIQRYNATAAAPNSIVLLFPATPTFNDFIGVKEVGNSVVSVELNGNGNNLEGIGAPPGATQNLAIALVSVNYKFDGTVWRII